MCEVKTFWFCVLISVFPEKRHIITENGFRLMVCIFVSAVHNVSYKEPALSVTGGLEMSE